MNRKTRITDTLTRDEQAILSVMCDRLSHQVKDDPVLSGELVHLARKLHRRSLMSKRGQQINWVLDQLQILQNRPPTQVPTDDTEDTAAFSRLDQAYNAGTATVTNASSVGNGTTSTTSPGSSVSVSDGVTATITQPTVNTSDTTPPTLRLIETPGIGSVLATPDNRALYTADTDPTIADPAWPAYKVPSTGVLHPESQHDISLGLSGGQLTLHGKLLYTFASDTPGSATATPPAGWHAAVVAPIGTPTPALANVQAGSTTASSAPASAPVVNGATTTFNVGGNS